MRAVFFSYNMTRQVHTRCAVFLVMLMLTTLSFFSSVAYAAEAVKPDATPDATRGRLSMMLTPPLYQLSLAPGATWSSTLQFANNNAYDLFVYAFTQNFRSNEETGVSLLPSATVPGVNAYELASWITPEEGVITVKHGATINIPFTIAIPKNAEPGGHYAAIVVGTAPQLGNSGTMSVGAQLSSLLLVRVIGDVLERGTIEDFYAVWPIVQTQEALFSLQFKNIGNVHVAPEGTIVITNMFGRERGRINIDGQNPFGSVLPDTSRKFVFDWKGEQNFFDIGRYTARVSLTFGDNSAKHVYYTAHFWVLPWMPFFTLLLSLTLLTLLTRRFVRRYVARAIVLEEQRLGSARNTGTVRLTFSVLRRPIVLGMLDLSQGRGGLSKRVNEKEVAGNLLPEEGFQEYWRNVAYLFVFIFLFLLIGYYFYQVFQDERSYQMMVQKGNGGHLIMTGSTPL